MIITEDNGAFIPFVDELGKFAFHQISNHAIDRMWQRLGVTVKDFFVNEFVIEADTTHHLTKYDGYGYDDSTYIMTIGKCFFIVCIDGNKIVVKTDLAWDMLHPNQMALYVDSKRCAEKFASNTYNKDATILNGIGLKNTSDAIRAICA